MASKEEKQKIRRAFQALDKDKDGKITYDEVFEGKSSRGFP